jgi:hypothetical protein
MLLIIEIVVFSFTFWLGLYLLQRNFVNIQMRFAGFGAGAYAWALALDILGEYSLENTPLLEIGRAFSLYLPLFFWILVIYQLIRRYNSSRPHHSFGLVALATLFFGLGLALYLLPLNWLLRTWLLPAIGLDFLLLGYAIAALDAFDEGQSLIPDMTRSLISAGFAALLFGSVVVITLTLGDNSLSSTIILLLLIVSCAIAVQVYADTIQFVIDRLSLAGLPRIRRERAELRAVATALPRLDDSLDLASLGDEEFARLTRRAISQLGDLPRLATSPLVRLPLIRHNGALESAAELKTLLVECIARLKPLGKGDFGTTDEWRHYNALYFPYVLGLKPYARRADLELPEPLSREALDWFRTSVPERTLHNWQTAATRLIARDLTEQNSKIGTTWQ